MRSNFVIMRMLPILSTCAVAGCFNSSGNSPRTSDQVGQNASKITAEVLFERSQNAEGTLVCYLDSQYQNVTIILSVGVPWGASSREHMRAALGSFIDYHFKAKRCPGALELREFDYLTFAAECDAEHALVATIPTSDFCERVSNGLSDFDER